MTTAENLLMPSDKVGLFRFGPPRPVPRVRANFAEIPPGCDVTAAGLVMAISRRAVPVSAALSGSEYERHLDNLAARVAAEDDRTGRPTCWACPATLPPGTPPEHAGWEARTLEFTGCRLVELYCRRCFHRWGWPDEFPSLLSEAS